jgi:DNA-binding MarR family transcriptional regulator
VEVGILVLRQMGPALRVRLLAEGIVTWGPIVTGVGLPDDVYARLLMLRTNLRRVERWSDEQAQSAGLTPMQHQLLLAIRGHADHRGPTIGEVADYLLLKHHSAGELVHRADAAGLVRRVRDAEDRRVTRLQLSDAGWARLDSLTDIHLQELERLSAQLRES